MANSDVHSSPSAQGQGQPNPMKRKHASNDGDEPVIDGGECKRSRITSDENSTATVSKQQQSPAATFESEGQDSTRTSASATPPHSPSPHHLGKNSNDHDDNNINKNNNNDNNNNDHNNDFNSQSSSRSIESPGIKLEEGGDEPDTLEDSRAKTKTVPTSAAAIVQPKARNAATSTAATSTQQDQSPKMVKTESNDPHDSSISKRNAEQVKAHTQTSTKKKVNQTIKKESKGGDNDDSNAASKQSTKTESPAGTSEKKKIPFNIINPLTCRWCSRGFRYPSEVRTHERTHTGEKPYACKFCGQLFSASSNLRRHERRHLALGTGNVPTMLQRVHPGFTGLRTVPVAQQGANIVTTNPSIVNVGVNGTNVIPQPAHGTRVIPFNTPVYTVSPMYPNSMYGNVVTYPQQMGIPPQDAMMVQGAPVPSKDVQQSQRQVQAQAQMQPQPLPQQYAMTPDGHVVPVVTKVIPQIAPPSITHQHTPQLAAHTIQQPRAYLSQYNADPHLPQQQQPLSRKTVYYPLDPSQLPTQPTAASATDGLASLQHAASVLKSIQS